MVQSLNINNNGVENWLRSAAALSDPYAAYSRALLYKLTAERVEPLVVAQVQPRSKSNATEIAETYQVSPNPASDHLSIDITNAKDIAAYQYKVFNLNGLTVANGTIIANATIPTSAYAAGVYIVTISKDGANVMTEKIVIIK